MSSYFDSKKWFVWENKGSEDCPPFGLIALYPWENEAYSGAAAAKKTQFGQATNDTDDIILHGTRPNDLSANRQNPALLAVNGNVTVKAGNRGQCSVDWPALVYVDKDLLIKDQAKLRVGDACGPRADSWSISRGGTAFTILGHEPLKRTGSEAATITDVRLKNIHLAWVTTQKTANDSHWLRTIIGDCGTYPTGRVIPCEFGTYTFNDTECNDETPVFTPFDPPVHRYVFFHFGWRPLGSILRATFNNNRWWCMDEASEIYGEISEYGGIGVGQCGDFDVWYGGALTNPLQTIQVCFDKMASGAAAYGTMALVRYFPDEGHFSIVEMECN